MPQCIDMHMHVGLVGDKWPGLGKMSAWYRQQLNYKIFLLYAGIDSHTVSDETLRKATIETLQATAVDHVVCLALDPVYSHAGQRREEASHVWVANDYVLQLQDAVGPKVLFGASVHPYDPDFRDRTMQCVANGAVLMKWLPSAQQFTLADDRVRDALEFLATARNGKPLPLLLHCGMEYAIPTTDPSTQSYDFLHWSWRDKVNNWILGKKKWRKPNIGKITANLNAGLDAGAVVMFAHCGTPYFTSGVLAKLFEHDDFPVVQNFIRERLPDSRPGKCYGDVSAFCTPFRKKYFGEIAKLPATRIVFGSDFPTPAFELSADIKENLDDLKAVLKGQFERIIVPEDNLLDVNHRELQHAFPGHPMFGNFAELMV